MRGVLITGAAGGIGSALVAAFSSAGWRVIATDVRASSFDDFIQADLVQLAQDDNARVSFRKQVLDRLDGTPLAGIVNNAAVQILGSTEDVTLVDWQRSLAVNLTAPFRLVQLFLPELEHAEGIVLNIGSVHAQATKRGFVAYATAKAALHGMTRALAVDLGPRVRVLCLAPAAVSTAMLQAGFDGKPEAYAALGAAHPLSRLASPAEVANAAVAIAGEAFRFATGATFWLDGGVLSRLHDPG